MRTICAGYIDENKIKHICGKLLRNEGTCSDEISHGICRKCFKKFVNVFKINQKRKFKETCKFKTLIKK